MLIAIGCMHSRVGTVGTGMHVFYICVLGSNDSVEPLEKIWLIWYIICYCVYIPWDACLASMCRTGYGFIGHPSLANNGQWILAGYLLGVSMQLGITSDILIFVKLSLAAVSGAWQ